jgi:hypothetical protein
MRVLIVAAVLGFALGFLGPCPHYPSHDNFNVTKMRGLWYDYANEHGNYVVDTAECSSHIYMSATNETQGHKDLSVLTSIRDPTHNKTYTSNRELHCDSESSNPCTLDKQGHRFSFNWNVMATDHFGYAIIQECKSFFWLFHQSSFVIITRDKVPSRYLRHKIATKLQDLGKVYNVDFNYPELEKVLGEDPQRKDG